MARDSVWNRMFGLKCPDCRKPISDKDIFCRHCGVNLDKPIAQDAETSVGSFENIPVKSQPSAMAQDSARNRMFGLKCPDCGGAVSDKDIFCPHCGVNLDKPIAQDAEIEVHGARIEREAGAQTPPAADNKPDRSEEIGPPPTQPQFQEVSQSQEVQKQPQSPLIEALSAGAFAGAGAGLAAPIAQDAETSVDSFEDISVKSQPGAMARDPARDRMKFTTCPNCKIQVWPKPDGTCPSCQYKILPEEKGTTSKPIEPIESSETSMPLILAVSEPNRQPAGAAGADIKATSTGKGGSSHETKDGNISLRAFQPVRVPWRLGTREEGEAWTILLTPLSLEFDRVAGTTAGKDKVAHFSIARREANVRLIVKNSFDDRTKNLIGGFSGTNVGIRSIESVPGTVSAPELKNGTFFIMTRKEAAQLRSWLDETSDELREPLEMKVNEAMKAADQVKKSTMSATIRSRGAGLVVLGIAHFVFSTYLDPRWGAVLVALGVLNLAIPRRALFIANGIALWLVCFWNEYISIVGGVSWLHWVGLAQFMWGLEEFNRFEHYAPATITRRGKGKREVKETKQLENQAGKLEPTGKPCPKCGSYSSSNELYCMKCGEKLR